MRKILKSDDVIKLEEAVKIPDCIVRSRLELLPDSTVIEDNSYDENEEYQADTDDDLSELFGDDDPDHSDEFDSELYLREEQDKLLIEKEAVIKQAQTQAAQIMREAEEAKSRILAEAQEQAEIIKAESRERGYAEGADAKKDEIFERISEIEGNIKSLYDAQEEYFDEYANELKLLAIEVAEKVIAQKLSDDPKTIIPLVKSAVKSIRDVSWIKVEISDKMKANAQELERMLVDLKPNQNVEIELRRGADEGTCVVHTAEGVTVASVATQLENITEYFKRYKESGKDEPET